MGWTAVARAAAAGRVATWTATSAPSTTSSGWPGWSPPTIRGRRFSLAASSWAAKLAVVYAARRPTPLSGLLLLGPGLFPRVNLSPWRWIVVVAGHPVRPMARLPIPLTPELYTTNPAYREFVRADPLRLLEATTQFFWETARLDRRRRTAGARLDSRCSCSRAGTTR